MKSANPCFLSRALLSRALLCASALTLTALLSGCSGSGGDSSRGASGFEPVSALSSNASDPCNPTVASNARRKSTPKLQTLPDGTPCEGAPTSRTGSSLTSDTSAAVR